MKWASAAVLGVMAAIVAVGIVALVVAVTLYLAA